jgi:hypothetical protein
MYLARVGEDAIARFGYSRVAILRPEKERSIVYAGDFTSEDGVLFSNTSYKRSKYSYGRGYGTYGKSYTSEFDRRDYRNSFEDDYLSHSESRLESQREAQRSLFPTSSPIPEKSEKKEKKRANIRRLEL